jgi:hypothetical protein
MVPETTAKPSFLAKHQYASSSYLNLTSSDHRHQICARRFAHLSEPRSVHRTPEIAAPTGDQPARSILGGTNHV